MNTPTDQNKQANRRKRLRRFLRAFLIAIVLFVIGTALFLYFNIYFIFGGSGPAGPAVPAEAFKQIWTEQNVLLLGIGDSITDGYGASVGFSYFDRLIKNPPQDCEEMLGKNLSVVLPNLKAENAAVSGSDSIDHVEQIKNLKVQPPDVLGIVVMTTGGNDLIHNYGRTAPKERAMYGASFEQAKPWIDNYQNRLDMMVADIQKKFPGGCHIFLGNIYDPSDGTGNTSAWITGLPAWPDGLLILEAYNKIIADCATKYNNVHLIDIHSCFLGHGIHCKKFWIKHYRSSDPHFWYHMIIEDPNDRGYDALRRLFLIEIAKVFFNKN